MTSQMPPGWYDDPDGSPNAERRWDGYNWTPERRRKSTQRTSPSAYPPPPSYPQSPQAPPPLQSAPSAPYPPSEPLEAPYQQPPPPQAPAAAASNLLSIIAFVCAGLAMLGGVTLVALPTIFGVAAIICAVVALTKKERLAPYALGAAIGGLILGWIIQAAVFNSVFS